MTFRLYFEENRRPLKWNWARGASLWREGGLQTASVLLRQRGVFTGGGLQRPLGWVRGYFINTAALVFLGARAHKPHVHTHAHAPSSKPQRWVGRACPFSAPPPNSLSLTRTHWTKWEMCRWFDGGAAWMPADPKERVFMDWSPSSPEQIWGECERWGGRSCGEDLGV